MTTPKRRKKPVAKAAAAAAAKTVERPAETGGVSGSVVLIVGRAAGITDPDVLVAMGVIVGFIPAGITWLVGTIRGASGTA